MKYLYRVIGGRDYYADRQKFTIGSNISCFNKALVLNDPDDHSLHEREMYAYGYQLEAYSDREYFLAKLRGYGKRR